MIACNGCKATLPDWAQRCQFCGSDVTKVTRPQATVKKASGPKTANWVWGVYYALAAYWVLSGVGGAIETVHNAVTPVKFMGETITPGFGFFTILSLVISVLTVLLGIGFAAKVELARGIANFFAGLKIIFALFGLAGSVLGTLFAGPLGLILMAMNVLDIIAGALTLYVIGETEQRAPNF